MEKSIEQKYEELEYNYQKALKVINKLKERIGVYESVLAENEVDEENLQETIKVLYQQVQELQPKDTGETSEKKKSPEKKNKEKKTK